MVRIPGLAERMADLMDIERDEASDEKQVVDEILVQMWRFANTYWVRGEGIHTQLQKMRYLVMRELSPLNAQPTAVTIK